MLLDVEIRKKLREFELDIRMAAGKGCLGILGSSGCGKSMTLKSIAGIVQPDSGHVVIREWGKAGSGCHDRVLYDSSQKVNRRPQARRIGYLFQHYALFPNMTVGQNIRVGLDGTGGTRICAKRKQEIVDEMVRRFRLDGLENRYPPELSGGQQQRAALARILAYGPDVVLLDEPFSAMDTFLKERLRLELAEVLQDYGGIFVMVTHDRDEAYQLCDHLMLMDQGKVLAAGETRAVFCNPGTCQAARLTGCKNISRIRRLGAHRVCALDWDGLELVTEQEAGEDITAIGIRAHDFEPLSDSEAKEWQGRAGANLVPVLSPKVSEMPFEWYITLQNGLWWKIGKDIYTHDSAGVAPPWLRVRPSAILLLRE